MFVFFLFAIFLLVIFVFIIFLDLGLSIGVSFLLTWLLPNISFEIGVVIGAICSNFSLYFFVRMLVSATEREKYNLDKTYRVEEEYDEDLEEDVEYMILPPSSAQRRRKKRQKRNR